MVFNRAFSIGIFLCQYYSLILPYINIIYMLSLIIFISIVYIAYKLDLTDTDIKFSNIKIKK